MHLIMLCPTLVDLGGHEFDYTKEVADAAQTAGARVTTIIPQNAAGLGALPGSIEKKLPAYGYPNGWVARIATAYRRFSAYCRIFREFETPSALWFVHSAPPNEYAVIALAWLTGGNARNHLFLFFRQEIDGLKNSLAAILTLAARRNVHYASDSGLIAQQLAARFHCRAITMPIPVPAFAVPQRNSAAPLCGYFGARRRQKGFGLLPALIEAAQGASPTARFTVQAYSHRDDAPDATLDEVVQTLRKRPNVRLIEDILDADAFLKELAACDIVFIPYDPVIYRKGTSGIFVMAVAARALTIVSEGSWMAHVAEQQQLNRVLTMPFDAAPEHMRQVMTRAFHMLTLPDKPSNREQLWVQAQSGKGVWETLVNSTKLFK